MGKKKCVLGAFAGIKVKKMTLETELFGKYERKRKETESEGAEK